MECVHGIEIKRLREEKERFEIIHKLSKKNVEAQKYIWYKIDIKSYTIGTSLEILKKIKSGRFSKIIMRFRCRNSVKKSCHKQKKDKNRIYLNEIRSLNNRSFNNKLYTKAKK